MTDRGNRARWTTAALVAPTAAALFTGTAVWASGHQPVTTTASATPTSAPPKAVDPALVALRQAVAANSAQVSALRKTVATIKAQAAVIAKGTPAASVSASSSRSSSRRSSSSGSSSSSSSSHKSSGGSSKVVVSQPAPPPPSQGSSGASGAKP